LYFKDSRRPAAGGGTSLCRINPAPYLVAGLITTAALNYSDNKNLLCI
jgi:hypothetical protein